jgi:nitrile hydratase accessory protein
MNPADLLSREQPFREPWEAQAFALTVALHERGVFTWAEWADALGARIAEAAGTAQPADTDDGSAYYVYWLDALRRLLDTKGVISPTALDQHTDAWDRAARATPHGRPIDPPPVGT